MPTSPTACLPACLLACSFLPACHQHPTAPPRAVLLHVSNAHRSLPLSDSHSHSRALVTSNLRTIHTRPIATVASMKKTRSIGLASGQQHREKEPPSRPRPFFSPKEAHIFRVGQLDLTPTFLFSAGTIRTDHFGPPPSQVRCRTSPADLDGAHSA